MTNVNFFNRFNRVRQFAMDTLPLRYLCATLLFLTLGVGQIWAGEQFSISGGYVYFDNTTTNWTTSNIQFLARQGSWSGYVDMSNVTNTKLFVCDVSGFNSWGKTFYAFAVVRNSTKKSNGNTENSASTKYTGYQENYGLNSGSYYIITPSSSSNGCSVTTSYKGAAASSLNNTITVGAKKSDDNGGSYSDAASGFVTLSASSKKFTTYNSCATSTSLSSGTISCGYTATTTLTAPETDPTGYKFDGWYNSSGTRQTTSKTLTIYPTGTATYYAYYRKMYTFSAESTIVWDLCGNEKSWNAAYLYKDIEGGSGSNDGMTQCGSTTQYKKTYESAIGNVKVFLFRGQNGSTWSNYKQTTDIYRDASGVTLYEFDNSYTGVKLNWQVTTGAKKATSGVKVYFDKTNAWNGEIWLKYGTTRFNRHTGAAATKVTGTENLYVITMPEAYYTKWYFASSYGWTDRNTIEDTHVGNRIPIQTTDLTSDITFVPTGSTSGSNPTQYAVESFSGHTRRLTFGSHTNGQITVRYTDESGVEQTVSSASADYVDVAQTCNVVITAVPNTSYAPSGLTLGGNSITSGATQTIRANGTIDATFVQETTYNITVSYKYGSRTLHADNVVSVGVTTPSSISSETIDGFEFDSWSNLTNVTNNTGNLTTDPISINSTAVGSMTCNYTPWTCSLDLVASQGATGHSSRTAMNYDATEQAYYINRTTASATERYRFYINGIEYSTDGNVELQINETKVDANVDVTDYLSNKPSVYFNDGPSGSKITIWFNYETKKAWVTEQKHTVTVSAGSHGRVSPTSVTAGAITASATITATADDNYHWDSWTLPNSGVTIASGSGTRIITINATADDKEVIANFAGDQYTITYKDQGDVTYSGSNLASLPTPHTYGTATALVNGTKTGYNFIGWYTDASCTISAGSSIGATAKTANFTLYAKWTAINYTTSDNIKNSDNTTAGQYNVNYDATSISYTTTPSKTGYSLVGLYKQKAFTNKIVNNDRSIVSGTTDYTASGKWHYTSAPNLYAKWQANTYSITLHDNNGGNHNGSATATYDSNKLTSVIEPTKTGYHLVDGYYKEEGKTNLISDLSGNLQASTAYTTSTSLWNSTSGQTLYAKWAANTYTIAFNANDGQYVGTATGSTSSVAATYGVYPTLTSNGFSREGYTFAGWATSPTGAVVYSNGQTLTTNLTNDNNVTVTLYAKWTPKEYTVSFNARGGSGLSKSSMTVTMGSNYGTLATVTPPAGKVFSGWYTSAGGGTLVESSTQVTTANDHTLYAHYVEQAQVYFKNTLGWSKVFVAYNTYWDNDNGTGNYQKIYHEMQLVSGSDDVYYDVIPETLLVDSWGDGTIAFNSKQLDGGVGVPTNSGNYGNYNSGEVVYRMDFDSKASMFVPTNKTGATDDGNYLKYGAQYRSTGYRNGTSSNPEYTSGYWRTFNDNYSGYSMTYQKSGGSWSSGHKMETSSVGDNVFVYTVHMDANSQYNFAFYKECTTTNTKSCQFCYDHYTQITSSNCTNLVVKCEPQNSWMMTTVEGDYTFMLEMKNDGHMYLTVEYPFKTNDYRVRYDYTPNGGSAQHYYSEIIKGRANGLDTISVFIHSADSATSRALKIEKCTGIDGSGNPTWNTSYATITLPAETAAGKTREEGKTASGVYNFIITQNSSAEATGAYWKRYDGNYYIRTDVADGGWDLYKYRADNIMTLSEYSLTQKLSAPFSHYYCRFIESTDANITFTIATDYSPGICPVMTGDATIGNEETTLPVSANVRFSWNEETNKTRRAYLKNAQNENTRFLVLHGKADGQIFNNDASGTAIAKDDSKSLAKNELLFADLGNWIYQVELKAVPGAEVSLIARYNGDDAAADRYLIGSASSHMQIMGGSGSTKYEILAVYDFKTNRLMTVWKPGGDITQTLTDVDVLLIRHAQEAGKSITFAGGSLKTNEVYGALEFRYDELVGYVANWTSSSRPLMKFFISFPFDVNVSDIFGLNSAYGDAYVIQKYDGAERAEKGFFGGDGTKTFWKDLEPGDVMNANEGYCVIMDNDYLNNDIGSIWENKGAGSKVYLYFPSAGNVGSITSTSQTITLASHECKHDRTFVSTQAGGRTVNHKNTDSHWNMMGVPIFANTTDGTLGGAFVTSGEDGDGTFKYFYAWNSSNNKFAINTAPGYTFNSMHGYMVQYYGNVTFTGAHPAASVAARRGVEKENYQVELQILNSNADMLNRTYVELRENACDTFALNEDVYMAYNKNVVDIFTFAGNYDAAANVLSLGNHIVEVGVEVTTAGTYTFSMPSSFSGTVTLIDKVTGDRTNLALDDYEVRLEKGSITDRFLMEINIENVPSTIDGVNGEGSLKDGKAHKFLENGIMYILHNNRIYNANGMLVE